MIDFELEALEAEVKAQRQAAQAARTAQAASDEQVQQAKGSVDAAQRRTEKAKAEAVGPQPVES